MHIVNNAEELIQEATIELVTFNKTEWLQRVDEFLFNMSWDETCSKMYELMQNTITKKQNLTTNKINIYV